MQLGGCYNLKQLFEMFKYLKWSNNQIKSCKLEKSIIKLQFDCSSEYSTTKTILKKNTLSQ